MVRLDPKCADLGPAPISSSYEAYACRFPCAKRQARRVGEYCNEEEARILPINTPRYSIAACLVETAHRLLATTGNDDDANLHRSLGSALRGAEAQSFTKVDERQRVWGRQGLELELAFYDRDDAGLVARNEKLVAEEFSWTLGGYVPSVQLKCTVPEGDRWLSTRVGWPMDASPRHLHRYVLEQRDVCQSKRRSPNLDDSEYLILARRLRYRLGVDHANDQPDVFWWSTPQTEEWRYQLGIDQRTMNSYVSGVISSALGRRYSADPARNHADDWGCIRLSDDPIRVLTIGPHSERAETHSDVKQTLQRAGNQLTVIPRNLDSAEGQYPLNSYARYLNNLAGREELLHEVDVVVVYRGGGLVDPGEDQQRRSKPEQKRRAIIDNPSRDKLLSAVRRLTACGIEVVLGIGHGTTCVLTSLDEPLPIGVHEAVTPSAAAAWVVREHVNNRLANAVPDPGQQAAPNSSVRNRPAQRRPAM